MKALTVLFTTAATLATVLMPTAPAKAFGDMCFTERQGSDYLTLCIDSVALHSGGRDVLTIMGQGGLPRRNVNLKFEIQCKNSKVIAWEAHGTGLSTKERAEAVSEFCASRGTTGLG